MQSEAARVTREDLKLKQIVTELAEAQRRSKERLGRLEETVAALTEAQRRTEQRLEELIASHQRLTDKVAWIDGRTLEQDCREKAGLYFGRLLLRPRVVAVTSLWESLEAHLAADELDEVLLVDLIVQGRPRQRANGGEVWLKAP